MVIIEGMPYDMPMVYLKVAGNKEVTSLPFCEALGILTNVSYDFKASREMTKEKSHIHYVISGDTETDKNKTYVLSKEKLMERLQLDIYDDKCKIVDMAIQPEDERLIDEVKLLIGI